MSKNRGIIYENYIFNELLKSGLTEKKYRPAGTDKNKPDTKFKVGNTYYNLEIKYDLSADFGQGTLKYNFKDNKWFSYSENEKMDDILKYFEIEKFADEKWKKIPNRVGKGDIGRDLRPVSKLTDIEKKEDIKNFPTQYKVIKGSNPIAEYYNSKDTYYIQIGGNLKSGFYYMGSDPANLGVPEFKPSETKIRIRNKEGRFTTAFILSINSVKKSEYEIDVNPNFILNAGR